MLEDVRSRSSGGSVPKELSAKTNPMIAVGGPLRWLGEVRMWSREALRADGYREALMP